MEFARNILIESSLPGGSPGYTRMAYQKINPICCHDGK